MRTRLFLFTLFLLTINGCLLFDSGEHYCTEEPDIGVIYNYDVPTFSPDGDLVAFGYGGNPWGTDTVGIFFYSLSTDEFSGLLTDLPPLSATSPHFSPDGKWIVFHGGGQIWKIKANEDSLTQLTFSGRNFLPRWSPDGKKIIYDRTTPVDSSGVWSMSEDGKNRKKIVGGRFPDWHPEMKQVIFTGLGGSIYICDSSGGNVNKILDISEINAVYMLQYPRYSPDGSKIVFSAQRAGEGFMVWVMYADGSNPVALAVGDEPDWSPDGNEIIYTNTKAGGVWIMDSNGCNKEPLIGDFNFKEGGKR